MMKKTLFTITVLLTSFLINAQAERTSELYKILKVNDSIIFNASFNTCNLIELGQLINDDFEFYHDKAGLLEGKDAFIENTKNGLCKSTADLRRELKKGSLEVFPLNNNKGELYAAIQKGVHSFYENDKKGSVAQFTHLWVLNESDWKLKRVLSYDHKATLEEVVSDRTAITISSNVLMMYAGEYQAPKTGKINILMKNNSLAVQTGSGQMIIFPASDRLFFNKKQPMTFEFVKDSNGKVVKMKLFENGTVVEEASKVK